MKILIYEDNVRLRQSLVLFLNGMPDYQVVGDFSNCKNVVQEVQSLRPEVVLMDIDMPEVNGIEGVTRIKENAMHVKVLMHTVFDDNDKLFASLKAGADGYILKKSTPLQLLEAIKNIYQGGAPMSPAIARRVIQTYHTFKKDYKLTPRQSQLLQLLADGYSHKAIAAECHISTDTVATHLRNIYQKMQVQTATQAVAKGLREQLIH